MQREWSHLVVPAALAAACLTSGARAEQPHELGTEKARASLIAALSAANTLDLNLAERYALPRRTDGLVPLKSLRRSINVYSQRHFADRDAWGQDLLYWSDGRDYMILSYGADGEPDYDYDHAVPYEDVLRGTLTHEPRRDIVVVSGDIWQGPLFKAYGEATMAGMRNIAAAAETFAIDNNFYPGPTNGTVRVSTLAPDLTPDYIRAFRTDDEWGNPLLYWSDGSNYSIISTGADGIEDAAYSMWQASDFKSFNGGPTTEPTRDVVLINANFKQWPKGLAP